MTDQHPKAQVMPGLDQLQEDNLIILIMKFCILIELPVKMADLEPGLSSSLHECKKTHQL